MADFLGEGGSNLKVAQTQPRSEHALEHPYHWNFVYVCQYLTIDLPTKPPVESIARKRTKIFCKCCATSSTSFSPLFVHSSAFKIFDNFSPSSNLTPTTAELIRVLFLCFFNSCKTSIFLFCTFSKKFFFDPE